LKQIERCVQLKLGYLLDHAVDLIYQGFDFVTIRCHRLPPELGCRPVPRRRHAAVLFQPAAIIYGNQSRNERLRQSKAELRMLSLPAGALRMISAACFAALYGLCLLAPVVACAFGGLAGSPSRSFDDAAMVYCQSGEHTVAVAEANGSLDDPADRTSQDHAGSTAPSGNSAGDAGDIAPCCVSISAAVLTEPRIMSAPSCLASLVVLPPAGALIGQSPEQIIRPPIP
jgi:hypothetical protein